MEEQKTPTLPDFPSRQSRAEWLCALLWLPLHMFALPWLALLLFPELDDSWLNVSVYLVGAVWMLATQLRFLRRDFDGLLDRFGRVLLEVALSYGAMLLFNLALNSLLMLVTDALANPNNNAVMDMARAQDGPITALAVFLAPLVEELMFRAGIFGALRRRHRLAAYLVCMLLFALYHVVGYALYDPTAWVYLLQYLPIAYLLCRVYERTGTIWAPMLLHGLVNYLSLAALRLLEELI